MKKIISIALVVILVIVGIVYIPKLFHTCDDCGKFFVGAGYEPNIISDLFSDDEVIICKSCAKEQHKLSLAIGKDLDDYKKDIFE